MIKKNRTGEDMVLAKGFVPEALIDVRYRYVNEPVVQACIRTNF